MEPFKANTVDIVKVLLSYVQLVRPRNSSERVQGYFFQKMEGIMNQTIHYYMSYPI